MLVEGIPLIMLMFWDHFMFLIQVYHVDMVVTVSGIILQATEISHQSRSSIKSLLLKIPDNTVPLNTTPTPEKPTNGDKEENTVIIIVIVLAVVVAVVLVALVVLTVLVRKFSKKAIHPNEKQPQGKRDLRERLRRNKGGNESVRVNECLSTFGIQRALFLYCNIFSICLTFLSFA